MSDILFHIPLFKFIFVCYSPDVMKNLQLLQAVAIQPFRAGCYSAGSVER